MAIDLINSGISLCVFIIKMYLIKKKLYLCF